MEPEISVAHQRRLFIKAYEAYGGRIPFEHEYTGAIDALARFLAGLGQAHKDSSPGVVDVHWTSVYADIVMSDAVNAFVTELDGVYLIGITDGVVTRVFDQISAMLTDHGLSPDDRNRLNSTLWMFALLFALGHECAHITEGHLARYRTLNGSRCLAEAVDVERLAGTLNSYMEEAEADGVGVVSLAMGLGSVFQDDLEELVRATDVPTAIGLVHAAVGAMVTTLAASTPTALDHRGAYPHPLVRFVFTGQLLRQLLTVVITTAMKVPVTPLDDKRAFVVGIRALHRTEPALMAILDSRIDSVRKQVQELMDATAASVLSWLNRVDLTGLTSRS